MARGRMVSVTVATDKRLNDLSLEAEYLYLKTIPHLDRDGLILGDADMLASQAIPRRRILHDAVEEYVQAWITTGLALAYDSPDGRVLFFPSFAKHQAGMRYDREPESTIAAPPGYTRTSTGLVPDANPHVPGVLPEAIRQTTGTLPEGVRQNVGLREEKLREVEVEGKGREMPPTPLPADDSANHGRRLSGKMNALNNKLGPEIRRLLADVVLDILGTRELANTNTDAGDTVLYAAHDATVTLWDMGYRTEQNLLDLEAHWYANDFRGKKNERPTAKWLIEHASKKTSGTRNNGSKPHDRQSAGANFGLASLKEPVSPTAEEPDYARLAAEWDAAHAQTPGPG
jgi:hypothetical protein